MIFSLDTSEFGLKSIFDTFKGVFKYYISLNPFPYGGGGAKTPALNN